MKGVKGFPAFRRAPFRDVKSLGEGGCRALVDASAAVDAFRSIDDSDVIAGDGSLRADVHTCSACNTLRCVNCNHCDYLGICHDEAI